MLRRLSLLCCVLMLVLPVHAQTASELLPPHLTFSPEGTYNPEIPSPADVLGYELGTQFTPYHAVVSYMETLDAASDRITMQRYGQSHEGRPLYYLTVTSEANHDRLEAIRTNNLRLTDPRGLDAAERETLLAEQPAVLWLSYNVHGNEASSSEAVMQVAYRLAAGEDAEITDLLDSAVVLLDPCINPDGRDRYVNWYRSMQTPVLNTDPYDLEHDEPWPGGRTNHYWFDLNRDWVWLVHPESQGRIKAYQDWMPQIHVDYHEQGFNENYFTMPGTTPRNLNLPDDYERWSDVFGRANIAAFDEHQISYATREAFDFFYPGYGSSYPSIMGAIGMLTEQGGHSRGGRAVETNDGFVLTLRQRIFDHYTTSIATLKEAVAQREDLLRYFHNAFTPATNKSSVATYLLPDDASNHTYDVISMLLAHQVEVHRAERDFQVRSAYSYRDGAPQERTFEAGTFVIQADQPRHLFVNTVLQREMAIEDSVMYDMATWSAPLAYNLDAAWTTRAPDVSTERVLEAPVVPTGVENPGAQYAYVVDWAQRHAPRALAHLWRKGYRVRSAFRPFTLGDQSFSRGSLVVLLGRNREKADHVEADMAAIAEQAEVTIVGLNTGRMDTGMDLASRDSQPLDPSRIALMVDEPFSSYTSGQLWYLFDHASELGITRLRTDRVGSIDLDLYDVLVLPGAYGLSSAMDSTMVDRLRRWVADGGTLVATENSAGFFTHGASGLTPVRLAEATEEEEDDEAIPPAAFTPYEARSDSSGLARIPGSALLGHLDTTHPLAFGMPETVYTLKQNTLALRPDERTHTVGRYEPDPSALLVSGYASTENLEHLAGNAFAAVREMGDGQVVFLTDNTQFRMFWIGPSRLVLNAVLHVPGM